LDKRNNKEREREDRCKGKRVIKDIIATSSVGGAMARKY